MPTPNRSFETDLSNGYEAVAAEFLAGRGRAPSSAVGARPVRDWARTLPSGAAVIDLGCGSGLPITKVPVGEGLKVYVQMMKSARPAFASDDSAAGTADEVSAAFHGYVAYYGSYRVDEGARVVTHRLAGSLFPNWLGSEQRREIVLEGDRLTLSTPPIPFEGKDRVFR